MSRVATAIAAFALCVALTLFAKPGDGQSTLSCNSFANWQAYYSSWFTMYPTYAYYNMYPFGTTYCDNNASVSGKSYGFNPGANFPIPFFGSNYKSLWVSPYGYIMFNETANNQIAPLGVYLQINWPNPDYPTTGSIDPPFAAPFYANINYRIGVSYEPSQISYRVLDPTTTTSTSQQNIMEGMLNQISLNVRQAVVGAQYFSAQRGVVITYYNVTLYGNPCTTGQNLYDTCLRNTFQVAIVTDYVSTYTVYNYFNITWIGSNTLQNCDPTTGQFSAAYPNCIPAQIGFNSGFARGFTSLPYSETANVINMATYSGTNVTGRWIYKISGDVVQHGGCTNNTALGSSFNGSWPLVAWPMYGPQFGGNVVNVSGPCFLPGQTIKCKFGQAAPVLAYYWGDMMQVMCVQPVLYEVGPIELSVSTDGGANYYFRTMYTVIQQEYVPDQGVQVVNTNNDWLNPTTIQLTWNPLNLSSEWGNQITIQLLGYANQSWQVIYTFAFQAANTGTFTFTYSNNMCYQQNNGVVCAKYDLGAFRVSLSDWQWDPLNPMALWSSPVPLGWFMKDQVQYYYGGYWASNACQKWFAQDSQSTAWHTYLQPCPCTLNQSYVDFGRFLPTPDCNLLNYNSPGGCPRNPGAMACYQSTNVTSFGSSNRCCYNKYGNLMYTGDGANGSISQRASPNGQVPYVLSPYVPSISDWQIDLLPWYYCCQWQSSAYDCFNLYMSVRQTQDCVNYNVPGHATVYGDPHFNTMDGTLYTFNAWGEFWLLQVVNAPIAGGTVSFSMQARFQQPFNQSWGQIRGTVMTAIAMQLNNGTVVSVATNLYNYDEHLLVYVNSTLLNFSFPSNYYQQFPEFIIINNDPPTSKAYSNFTISFKIGIGINVAWANGVMQLFATIPPAFLRATGGLFGYWNGNPADDLMPRGSTGGSAQAISASDSQSVFYSFGMTWIVQSYETIFTYLYRSQLNYYYYRNTWFIPYFTATIPPNGTVTTAEVTAVCNTDAMCQYDYMVAENQTMAINTHAVTMWDAQLRTMGAYVTSCGWLNIPDAIRQQPVSYTVGSQVSIVGCMSGFLESGSTYVYLCQSTGYQSAIWSPSTIGVQCNYLNGQLPWYESVEIAVPICIVTLSVIALLIFLWFHRRRRQRREERREDRKKKNTPPPPANLAAAFDPVQLQEQTRASKDDLINQQPYNNVHGIVTGPLPEGYLDRSRQSRSSTPSKLSIVSHQSTMPPPPEIVDNVRPQPPSRNSSRPTTPAVSTIQANSRTVVTYSTDPNSGRERGLYSGRSTPNSAAVIVTNVPSGTYAVIGAGTNAPPPGGADRAADYYQRRYGVPLERSASQDSVV
jgi:hypothetical protein